MKRITKSLLTGVVAFRLLAPVATSIVSNQTLQLMPIAIVVTIDEIELDCRPKDVGETLRKHSTCSTTALD